MSFGFDVGNFADAAHLAYLIYRDCYKVARGAPQEFQLLVSEISTLSNSLKILQEDVQDPESSLVQAGDDRVKLVNNMVSNIKVTLSEMQKIARKYEIMGSTTASKGKQMWIRFKWTFDWSTIEKLRGKLNQHNTMMSLLLTQVGNSSLQKIQSSTNALESDIHEIRKHIAAQQGGELGNQEGSKGTAIPFLSFEHDELLGKDDTSRSSLSASLLKHAEVHQPWSTVGVSQWIETGTWWLLRAQLETRPIATQGSAITKLAYVALIKASWILIDIIACHPQVSFISSTTRGQIAALSTAIKREFEKIKLDAITVGSLRSIDDKDLYIWEDAQEKVLSLRPQIPISATSLETTWAVDGDEKCLFLGVARCDFTTSGLNVCIVMFLIQADGRALRLVAKQQIGEVMLDIPFTKPVQLDISGNQVTVDRQEIILDTQEEARRLSCLIEAANLFILEREANYFSVQAFTFWLILVAVKHGYKELLSALYPSPYQSNPAPVQHDSPESPLYQVTTSLAQEFLAGEDIHGPRCDFHGDEIPSARDLGWLYWAIWIGNSSMVNLFMLEGVTATDNPWHDLPPLHIAAMYGHDAVAHTVVANSSKDAKTLVRETDKEWKQALWFATLNGHEDVSRSLLRWGAEVDNIQSIKHRMTALHVAAEQGHSSVVQLLLDNGAGVDTLDCERLTALHKAAKQGHASVVQLLLDNGARQDARDDCQMTPLLCACDSKRESVIALFARRQLDFSFRDKSGRSAWQIAINSHNGKISQSTFDTIMQSFWAGEKPQTMPLPKQRRAIVSLSTAEDWDTLTLDSRYARIEHPKPLPSHMVDLCGRGIEFDANYNPCSRATTYEFHIIYACKTLDFSITYGYSSFPDTDDSFTVLSIRGGGNFFVSAKDNSRGLDFQSSKNIETDPYAEEVL